MRTNVATAFQAPRTHEGAVSKHNTPIQELRRTTMSCMLFEDNFYEAGNATATRMAALIKQCKFEEVAAVAIEAREQMKLRHAPLFLVRELLRGQHGRKMGDLIARVVQRPDEIAELVAIYWKDGRKMLPAQMKIGLGRALKKFSTYQLAKWNKEGAVLLRDVMFLCHVRPKGMRQRYAKEERRAERAGKPGYQYSINEQEKILRDIADDTLPVPGTWENELSDGKDKKETFTRLIKQGKLGALALLRNLRGMLEVDVSEDVIREGLCNMSTERVLPFRFIAAARHAPRLEDAVESAMLRCLHGMEKLGGKTALLIDHSQSMESKVSAKSEISRFDAAAAVALILREVAERVRVFTFSDKCIEIPPRRGFAMVAAVNEVRNPVGTLLGSAVRHVYNVFPECERIIVITDEQSHDRPPQPHGTGYIVNVATYGQGIAYGPWVTINGWSEAIVDYIRAFEAA